MKSFTVAAGAVVGTALMLAGPAANAGLISASAVPTGAANAAVVVDGTTFNFAATGGTITDKTLGGFTGLGVSGLPTSDEIDVRETLGISWIPSLTISSITLGVLFDGPEFDDVEEIAEITATLAGGGTLVGRLTNSFGGIAVWDLGGTVVNLSPDTASGGAVWSILNPFANAAITGISMTAISNFPAGSCPSAPGGNCTNDSDFTFVAMTVPEPGTLGLLGAALVGLGAASRRRRQS